MPRGRPSKNRHDIGTALTVRIGPINLGEFGGKEQINSTRISPMPEQDSFPISNRNRLRRRHERGRFDRATVYDILDSAMVAHIAYVIDGQPYCTPTGFWREDDRLYWHGSSASRMIRGQSAGVPVCVTATHLDAIVLARSGFHHSVNYRSVMAFGTAEVVTDVDEKLRLMDGFVDRLYPGRSREIRPANAQEVKATSFVVMPIDEASGKIRSTHVSDDEEDYDLPIWAARIPVRQVLGEAEPCPRQLAGLDVPAGMRGYRAERPLDETLLEAYRLHYPE
jgi:nitroimidazol reductase NimA-like FMN-containing flavoprotein (pyridoxamine 5'-phosphate oxidase superfamily)